MVPSIDELKYATDTRNFRDAVLQDNIFKNFTDSLTKNIKVNDVCIYAEGDTNKVGGPKIKAGEAIRYKHGNPILDDDGNEVIPKCGSQLVGIV